MFAIWFTFQKNDERYLFEIINKLGKKYEAQVFLPHITAYGLVNLKHDELDKIILDSIRNEIEFEIEKKIITHSDDFWKTIFIEINLNEHLQRINKKLKKSLGIFSSYEFRPHVSLIYKKINPENREKIIKLLDVKKSFIINGMCIQEFSEDISKWNIVSKYQLKKL